MDWRLHALDGRWHRLIPSRFPPVDVYARLGSPELGAAAKEIESLTNPRLRSRDRLLGSSSGADKSAAFQNWNHAPFAYKNPEGSTFLSPLFGAVELMADVRPAIARAILQREKFLGRTRELPIDLDMRLLITGVQGSFADLRGEPFEHDREKRWAFGGTLRASGVAGVLFRHPDLPSADALAVLDPSVLRPSVQSAHYRFVWNGTQVSSVYDFSSGEEMRRQELLSDPATA